MKAKAWRVNISVLVRMKGKWSALEFVKEVAEVLIRLGRLLEGERCLFIVLFQLPLRSFGRGS